MPPEEVRFTPLYKSAKTRYDYYMKNNTTENELLSTLVDRVRDRLDDIITDTIAEELETLFHEKGITDDDGEMMYDLFNRVYLGYQ
jgi:hypothetical protein